MNLFELMTAMALSGVAGGVWILTWLVGTTRWQRQAQGNVCRQGGEIEQRPLVRQETPEIARLASYDLVWHFAVDRADSGLGQALAPLPQIPSQQDCGLAYF